MVICRLTLKTDPKNNEMRIIMRPYIVANWKMHGLKKDLPHIAAIDLAAAKNEHVDVAIAVPATLIQPASHIAAHAAIGAQDCHHAAQGAHTGCLSAAMLSEAGAGFAIIGHSERRADQAESNIMVAGKVIAAQSEHMGAILCVGEDLTTRQSGNALSHVSQQLLASLSPENDPKPSLDNLTIAYEPIWAIGTGHVPEIADIAAMHDCLRAQLITIFGDKAQGVRILYGGSVNADNAKTILAVQNVNGALVGGASLSDETFTPIIEAA